MFKWLPAPCACFEGSHIQQVKVLVKKCGEFRCFFGLISPPVSVSAVLTLSLKTYGKILAIVASYFAALVFNINLSCQVHTHLSE